jgi:hypothetical protein
VSKKVSTDNRPASKWKVQKQITINRLQNTENAEASDNELTISTGTGAASVCAKDVKIYAETGDEPCFSLLGHVP